MVCRTLFSDRKAYRRDTVMRWSILLFGSVLPFLLVIFFSGCGEQSQIIVNICNNSSMIKNNVLLQWNNGEHTFKNIAINNCREIILTSLEGESALLLAVDKKEYPIDVYFESENYIGTINIGLLNNQEINVSDTIKLKIIP